MKPFKKKVSSKYGAPMGRRDKILGDPVQLHLQRVPLINGGYDQGGAYWGGGKPLYCAWNAYFCVFRRAHDRAHAKVLITQEFCDVSFLR